MYIEEEQNNISNAQEENFETPAVVEKINLSEVAKEKQKIENEEEQQKQQEISNVFDNFIKAFKSLEPEDIKLLTKEFAEKNRAMREKQNKLSDNKEN